MQSYLPNDIIYRSKEGFNPPDSIWAENEKDNLIRLTLIGCMSILLIQAFIHLGVNIRMFPTTGMTLPFISYGGSSLLIFSLMFFVYLNFDSSRLKES